MVGLCSLDLKQFDANRTCSEDHVISPKGLNGGSFCACVLNTLSCMQAIKCH